MEVIVQLISTVGFPIASWLALAWYIVKKDTSTKEQTQSFVDALNANTVAIQKLSDRIDCLEHKTNE